MLVFAPDGSLAGHADVMNRRSIQVSIYGGVHSQHRSRGVGTYPTRWGERSILDRMERAHRRADHRSALRQHDVGRVTLLDCTPITGSSSL